MKLSVKHIPLLATTAVCIALYAIGAVKFDGFATSQTLLNFFVDNSFLGIVAVGMTLVIISGGIDLSVGAVLALCSIFLAVLMQQYGVHPAAAIPLVLGLGSIFGLLMGAVIHYFKLEPFIVTLAGMFLARGLAAIISLESISIRNGFYDWVMEFYVPLGPVGVPLTAIIFIGIVLFGIYLSTFTRFGRNLYAVGGNEPAAMLMGLPIGKTKLMVYAFSGLCSALAAVVYTFYGSSGDPSIGIGMELDAIAIAVIGGTLLQGGSGFVFGTLIGTMIFGIINTGIAFQGTLSSWWTKVAVGVLLLMFVALQKLLSGSFQGRKSG